MNIEMEVESQQPEPSTTLLPARAGELSSLLQTARKRNWSSWTRLDLITLMLIGIVVFVMVSNRKSSEPLSASPSGAVASANAVVNPNQAAQRKELAQMAVIETTKGQIKIELLDKDAPQTVKNFCKLAESGFYDGLIFHRAILGFMIQGGDPNGNGTGGKTWNGEPLPNEIDRNSPLYQNGYHRGDMAMSNKGRPETGTSQFFIMHQDRPLTHLPPNYTIFARVVEGMEVVDEIADAPNRPGSDRPTNPVVMTKITILPR